MASWAGTWSRDSRARAGQWRSVCRSSSKGSWKGWANGYSRLTRPHGKLSRQRRDRATNSRKSFKSQQIHGRSLAMEALLLSVPFGGVQRRSPLHFGPAPERHDAPDQLDNPERPGALQEAVSRAQPAGDGKGQHEPAATVLEGIGDEHRRHGEEAEEGQTVH